MRKHPIFAAYITILFITILLHHIRRHLRSAPATGRLVVAALLAVLLAACDSGEQQATGAVQTRLPVSIDEVMVSQINHFADPYWQTMWASRQSDRDWRELERLVYQVQIGAEMMQVPGTGSDDQAWTDHQEWQQYARQLSQDGARALAVVRSRSTERMGEVGDQLAQTCEACHRVFRPDLPTLGLFSELPALPPVSN